MGRNKEPPLGFECPYQNACPHLGGMSARWASSLVSDIDNERFRDGHSWIEAEKEIKALDEENRQLAARVAELESRLKHQHYLKFKPNRRKPAGNDTEQSAPSPRKRGAPEGHPPWRLKRPDHIDRTVPVAAPTVCPHCQTQGLQKTENVHIQLQEDIVLQPRTLVTEYIHHLSYCPSCRREVFQTDREELRNCEIGPLTQAAAVFLRHEVKLSYRDVRKVFTGFFGMPFVPASAMAFSHRTAQHGMNLYEDLRDKIRVAHIAHGDETHWRIDGQGAQLWYAGNEQIGFFHADYSRSSDVAVSIFGTAFGGNLVADSYAAYNAINPKARQVCLSHLIRKAREIGDRIELMPRKTQDALALKFSRSISKFMAICCRIDQRRRNNRLSFSMARRHIPRLQRVLHALCKRPLADADAENLRQRITDPNRDAPHIFTFLTVKDMPPTNNHAERALRLPVIFRKISFGSRSLHGAQATAVNFSLLATAKRQQRDPISLFQNILLQQDQTPLSALYNSDDTPTWDSS
jgi:transposase